MHLHHQLKTSSHGAHRLETMLFEDSLGRMVQSIPARLRRDFARVHELVLLGRSVVRCWEVIHDVQGPDGYIT